MINKRTPSPVVLGFTSLHKREEGGQERSTISSKKDWA
jgi:hypothetical protein